MCFHVSDRVESTLVWPQDGNVFVLHPHKKGCDDILQDGFKICNMLLLMETWAEILSGRCERRHSGRPGCRGQITWLLLKFTC